ncbi:MAG: hypothetical protein SGJ02_02365 [bacterium]|nr:hypothetical protein [bacterium]
MNLAKTLSEIPDLIATNFSSNNRSEIKAILAIGDLEDCAYAEVMQSCTVPCTTPGTMPDVSADPIAEDLPIDPQRVAARLSACIERKLRQSGLENEMQI